MSYYYNRAAARDMILLATTSCEAGKGPMGGAQAFFGTNPMEATLAGFAGPRRAAGG